MRPFNLLRQSPSASGRELQRKVRAKSDGRNEARKQTRPIRIVELMEQSGATWFWETDPDGRILYLSPDVAKQLVSTVEESCDLLFTDLIESDQTSEEQIAQRALSFYFASRSSFDDVVVKARSQDDLWWSVTGRPVTDNFGKFFGFIGWATDLTQQHRAEVELNKLATIDALTGLLNRHSITQLVDDCLNSARKRASRCSLMLLDLDRFKEVNDRLGHTAGDTLLKIVALRLRQNLREQDRIGRLGGDEFMIVLPEICDTDSLSALAEGLIEALRQPYSINGVEVMIGVSVGVATSNYDDRLSADLIREADLALYAAKDAGRATYRFYSLELERESSDRRTLEDDLRKAIDSNLLKVVYQPSVNLERGSIGTFEALVRWSHPEKGEIPPSIFVPIAEDSTLIKDLGKLVLSTACRDATSWPASVKVAVNVSPIQITDPSLPKLVAAILTETGLPAARLELEVTESVFLSQDAAANRVIKQLKELGVGLALDDFGTGYSSLAYLYRAPFSKIKIDRSFVRSDGPKELNSAVIQSVVLLARASSMEVTAEGVESDSELALVKELGCTNVQGYIYGRPVSAVEALQLTKQQSIASDGALTSRADRRKVLRASILHLSDGHQSVRLRNISRTGALIEAPLTELVGTLVRLEIATGMIVEGEVRWSKAGNSGIRFIEEVDLDDLDMKGARASMTPKTMMPSYLSPKQASRASTKSRLTVKDL